MLKQIPVSQTLLKQLKQQKNETIKMKQKTFAKGMMPQNKNKNVFNIYYTIKWLI